MIPDTLKALSDDSRLKIALALKAGPLNVQELTSILGLSQPTVSHHLKILSAAGVIENEKTGTFSFYRLSNGRSKASELTDAIITIAKKDSSPDISKVQSKVDSLIAKRRNQAKQFFDNIAPQWKELRTQVQGDETYLAMLSEVIEQNATLLDLGCGDGALFEGILPRGGATYGVDYSEPMLEMARKNLGDRSSMVDLRLGYLEHLPFESGSIDIAVSHMVLHHIVDPKAVLKDAHRVLKIGGKLIVVDLTTHHQEEMREKFADLWLGFDPSEISEWASGVGFGRTRTELLGRGKAFLLEAVKV